MAELETMYPAQANTPETTLTGSITENGTSITVLDGSILPEPPNLLTIGADTTTAETVLMTAKSGNELTVERGKDGTAPRAWGKGDIIGRYFTAADQTALQNNVKKLNEGKIEKPSAPVDGNLVAFDGAAGAVKDSGKKAADFAAASHKHEEYVEKVKAPTDGNLVAFDGATGAVKDSGKKAADFAAATHSHTEYAEVKIFSSVSVAATLWTNSSTYPAYPFSAAVPCAGVTADFVPEVTFGVNEATGGIFAPVALSGSGTVTIYATEKPAGAIVLSSIKCEKAV